MPTKLRKLKITRVAVCPQGANPDADILLFKSATANPGADILLYQQAAAGVEKQEGVTVGDVYTDTFSGSPQCTDPDCDDPHCPVHGAMVRARRKKKKVAKGPVSDMGMHAEPDGDETPPLDYKTRGQQYDLWECLWGKWECFCTTFYDCIGDGDADNVGYLPILVDSIGQFQEDVAQLLVDCGVAKQVAPLLVDLHTLCQESVEKAGAAMAGHRRKRLQDAIAALQQILEECTPEDLPHGIQPPIDRAGVSAAEVAGLPGYMTTPALSKGAAAMAVRKNTMSDKEHCDNCDDDECENPAHDRMKKQEEHMAETIEGVTKRAELAEAQVKTLEARVAELEPLVAKTADLETTLAKMRQTPEEQEAAYWAGVPESVRKKHEADEAEKVELRKQLDEAKAEREQTVYLAKTADFRGFGMVPQKHWRILKRLDAWDGEDGTEDRDELLRLIKASQEQARTADLFKAHGTEGRNGSTSMEGGSASDRLMALTQARMDEKGEDFQKASEAITKQHRELYIQARREAERQARVSSD